jgi:two-component system chemotaxis sensor kinase CheA
MMDMSQYKDLFVSEAMEHLNGMGEAIVAVEGDPGDREKINTLFRIAHSLKGMGASMGYNDIADLSHTMEDLMHKVREGILAFDHGVADLLLEGTDLLIGMVHDVEADGTGAGDIANLKRRLTVYAPEPAAETSPRAEKTPEKELPSSTREREPDEETAQEETSPPGLREVADSQQTVRVRTGVLDNLINLTGELITNKNRMANIAREFGSPLLDTSVAELSRLLRELHDEVLKVRLMPFASMADRLPRVVRDLAKKSGKDVVFRITGKEIELDRGILEELSDPLLHILRNAVDHGLETREERLAAGKPPAGQITVEVAREKDLVLITLSDDGRGMDPARLVAAAIEKGLVKKEDGAKISGRQALQLICAPGFSTAQRVSDISGRGVGMDVVRSSVQSLGGSLSIESEQGKGSRFLLSLPLTISIIPILLVACSSLTVAFPVAKVLRTIDIKRDAVLTRGKRKVFRLGEEEVPLLSLHRLLGLPLAPIRGGSIPAVVVEIRGRKAGLVVDRFLGQQDVFAKPLGKPLNRMKGVSGGAILGDGQVVFILDPSNLV